MKKTPERNRVIVHAPNNFYFDIDFFVDDVDKIIEKLRDIKKNHQKFLKEIKADKSRTYDPMWDLIDKYEFKIEYYNDYETDVQLVFSRPETDSEYEKRIEANKQKSKAAIENAKKRKISTEKRERTLLETLKKKYESK